MFLAAPKPAFACSIMRTRVSDEATARTSSREPSVEPSSTTTTSSARNDCRRILRRHSSTYRSTLYTGTITLSSGCLLAVAVKAWFWGARADGEGMRLTVPPPRRIFLPKLRRIRSRPICLTVLFHHYDRSSLPAGIFIPVGRPRVTAVVAGCPSASGHVEAPNTLRRSGRGRQT